MHVFALRNTWLKIRHVYLAKIKDVHYAAHHLFVWHVCQIGSGADKHVSSPVLKANTLLRMFSSTILAKIAQVTVWIARPKILARNVPKITPRL